jgi:hypothetical protein
MDLLGRGRQKNLLGRDSEIGLGQGFGQIK